MADSFPLISVTEGTESDLDLILKSYPFSLRKLADLSSNTVLHLSMQNDKHEFLRMLLLNEKKYSNDMQITEWVNEVNQDGFTVLHMAATKGNLVNTIKELVKLFLMNGGNCEIRTPMGLDIVHLAAQNDFPNLIAYFSETSLDLETKDYKGLTPLHWASYMGSYHSALVLCSCRVSRNIQDNDGHTPLHLAVVGNNLRIVKLLIIKGCIKDYKDNQGKTPIDHAIVNRFTTLVESLKSNTFMEIMGFKPNITPFATSMWPFIILIGALICCFILIGVFCATYSRIASYLFAVTSTSVICFMVYIVNSNPGFLPKNPYNKLTDLYDTYKPSEICPDCKIVKIARSRHCHQCHRCVTKFDHHCQWMNNCIGAKNLGAFYAFIVLLFTNIILGIVLCCSVFVSDTTDSDGDNLPLTASIGVSAFCLVLQLFMVFPVGYLLYTHTLNFISGLTTNERMTAGTKPPKSNYNCCGNCYNMCCNAHSEELHHERFSSSALLEISMQEKD